MKEIDWEENNKAKDLAKSSSFSMNNLEAMRLVASMREAADRAGTGFVGGFISPTGERFMMSNIEDNDIQMQEINRQLDVAAAERRREIEQRINNADAIMEMLRNLGEDLD